MEHNQTPQESNTDGQGVDFGEHAQVSTASGEGAHTHGIGETVDGAHTHGIAPEEDPELRTDKGSVADPLSDADAAADLAGLPRPGEHPGAFVIAPSVGRKLHFYPNGAQFHSTPVAIDPSVPMDADVVYVWSDRMVNLNVRDHIGQVHAFTSVALRQPDDEVPHGAYAEWMPFQAAQARASA